jgi:hypothetical protein
MIKHQYDASRIELVWSIFHISLLCEKEVAFSEFCRSQYRLVFRNGEKVSRVNENFFYDLAI